MTNTTTTQIFKKLNTYVPRQVIHYLFIYALALTKNKLQISAFEIRNPVLHIGIPKNTYPIRANTYPRTQKFSNGSSMLQKIKKCVKQINIR